VSIKKIWTNGCYDILHIGHIALFEYAKSLGSQLIVGIDSDKRVKKLKGQDRPFNCEADRKKMLESIKYIDKVFIFDNQEQMCNIVRYNSIHAIVVGDEYKGRHVTASDIVDKVIYFTKIKGYSTTSILDQK
tara:strand:+ start:2857 stop:3252 length:396 start_codon:yes stop_codon:yes gene_type:complete